MESIGPLAAFVLASMGLTVVIVWPQEGPGAWIRERVLRRLLGVRTGAVFDCYICFGFWAGLVLSPLWWWWTGQPWFWTGCLMTTAGFWMVLRFTEHGGPDRDGEE